MLRKPTAVASLLFVLLTMCGLSPAASGDGRPKKPAVGAARLAAHTAAFDQHVLLSYAQAGLAGTGLPVEAYRRALIGYYSMQQRGAVPARPTLTIIDFSRPSRQKRLWVLDVVRGRLLHHTLVAHGRNTGEDLARNFSNQEGSEMSSLGFYLTGTTYQGKHGLSLKLHGLDPGYNTNAFARAVVVHGADYVSEAFARQHGRLGRSQGCPALPVAETPIVINAIKGGTVLFIHGPVTTAYASSWLNLDQAVLAFARSRRLLS
ncbi:murein L,D-transpeptidase catalytic domain family protein [Hymenobacter weizhouensis]|uniref:murein L,D-transpeptidase catalytic domain family protein n=1 Tax=Hymenobacter sp. YIM 151500-1 TaxID=2987689 RepID=UPI0022262F07|nr:murein L,D-transpeptidase catalytic domain family protein [Hymenobacter sp. YIM 151500-1]UYZ64167.1 murein L,D-transpeptidase catalytic domain family protein [Hymenobacter sp. YIM 151500-1]